MIKLKKLTWSNCFSYGENNELDLSSDTLTQLVGTNGTGKSSIPLILEEVLFNKNSKGIKKADIANRKVDKGYSINLSFAVNDDEYVLDVSRKGNIKCRLWKNDEDISSHTATNTYKTLEQILGIDFKTFSQIVYQNTNASLQFLTATDTNRKKFLIDLLQLDNYVKYFEVFKEMSRELGTEISSVEGKLSTIEKWLNDNKLEDTSLLPKLDLPIYSEQDEKQLRSLQVEFENITQTNKKINTNNYWKEQLQLIDLDKYKMVYGEVESYDELQEELGKWRGVAFQSKFEGTDEEVCPTCGQDVDNNLINQMQENQEKEINEAEKEIQSIREEIATIKSNNEIINERDSKRKEWEDCYRSIDQGLPSEILSAENLQQSIDDLEATISKQKERLQEVIEENTSRERHNTRIGL